MTRWCHCPLVSAGKLIILCFSTFREPLLLLGFLVHLHCHHPKTKTKSNRHTHTPKKRKNSVKVIILSALEPESPRHRSQLSKHINFRAVVAFVPSFLPPRVIVVIVWLIDRLIFFWVCFPPLTFSDNPYIPYENCFIRWKCPNFKKAFSRTNRTQMDDSLLSRKHRPFHRIS